MSVENSRKAEIKAILKKLRSERTTHLKAVQARIKNTTALRSKIKKALMTLCESVLLLG